MANLEITYKGTKIVETDETTTKTLLTKGKYCEDDFIVDYTAGGGGSDELVIVNNTVTTLSIRECQLTIMSPKKISLGACTSIGAYNFRNCAELEILNLPACTTPIPLASIVGCQVLRELYLPMGTEFPSGEYAGQLEKFHYGSLHYGVGLNNTVDFYFSLFNPYAKVKEVIMYVDVTSDMAIQHISELYAITQIAPQQGATDFVVKGYDGADGREFDLDASYNTQTIVYK